MSKIKSVLLVCTGNSCRSIMAEGLLKKALKELGKDDVRVGSAGVNAVDGLPPMRETVEVMKREGIDVSGFKSKALTDEDIMNFGLILVMATHHMHDIVRMVPLAASKTHLLRQYGLNDDATAGEDPDIQDPIGKPVEVYERILGVIKEEAKRVARIL